MGSLIQTFRFIRYKIDYYYVDYKQRYYSTNRNPRIIQTKLQNKQLISLRTFPKDKYFTKPGEYLMLEPKSCDVHELPLSSSSPLEPINEIAGDVVSFLSFDETFIQSHNRKNRKVGVSLPTTDIRINSVPDLMFSSKNNAHHKPSTCICECHENNVSPLESLELVKSNPKELKQPKSSKVRERFKRYIRIPSKSTHPLPLNDPPSNIDSNIHVPIELDVGMGMGLDKEKNQDNNPLLLKLADSPIKLSSSSSSSPLISPQQQFYSLVSKLSSSSLLPFGNDSSELKDTSTIMPKSPKVWKTVLNEVSLSAARISTGSTPSHLIDSRKVSADFIDAKSLNNNENEQEQSETDLFAVNLAQAKMKYNAIITKSNHNNNVKMSTLLEKNGGFYHHYLNRNGGQRHGSNTSAVTGCGTVAMGELYGDNGILAMYNDSEPEDD
ncbi:hypothetical protein DFJ63DRAFT_313205 [Scheffersomyces coipomensis]|uniref:uncharacterized protein n=1 Tax=Scheffersomyces coipomensis TaxID=1788519 RepID=UPI00315D5FF5